MVLVNETRTINISGNIAYGTVTKWKHINSKGDADKEILSPLIVFVISAEIISILVRNDNNIKGNCIGVEEYKLTQYADETTFILDGTLQSLKNTMILLHYHSDIFNLLDINFTLNLDTIIAYNYNSKRIDLQNLMKLWPLRNI